MVIVIMCNFKKLGKYQVKYMNVYINPCIDELLNLWADFTMYDICKPIREKQFKLCGIILCKIHYSRGLTHFFGM
jgi:hypothetical protein